MNHRNVRGKILYISHDGDEPREYGREWFTYTFHEDGQLTVRSQCEIEPGPVEDRSVIRDVTYTVDRDFKPVDGYVRLQQNGKYLGSGWFRVTNELAECESFNVTDGRVRQRFELDRPVPSIGAHALTCDVLHLARFDHSKSARIQPAYGAMLTSLEHDGCSGPMLAPIRFEIEYLGRDEISVPAGAFEADHYQFLLGGTLPKEHPTEELWCVPEEFIFVKIAVGGYMNSTFELAELQRDL
jgi:hypothetical protein